MNTPNRLVAGVARAIAGIVVVLAGLHVSRADAQCAEPFVCGTSVCEVDTQAELQAALDCLEAPGNNCLHIRIPSGCTLDVTSTISIGHDSATQNHDNLHLEIAGTLRYTGTSPTADVVLIHLAGAQNILIDGGGTITSTYDADDFNCPYPCGLPKAFRLSDNATNLTIRDLNINNLGTAIESADGDAQGLDVINVHAIDMSRYGFFASTERLDATFENCSVNRTIVEHPFRFYVEGANIAPGLVLRTCWSYRSGKTGLWILEGDDVLVDRFSSDQRLQFGPDHSCTLPNGEPCANGPLTNVFAQELHSTDLVRAEMGLQGACLVNVCTPSFEIGRSSGVVVHDFPLHHVNWDDVSVTASFANNPLIDLQTVHEISYNYCFANIAREPGSLSENAVDVDDLIAVILAWGACEAAPAGVTGPPPPCAADIVPHVCGNDVVDVDDLIEVILTWGGCDNPPCGSLPGRSGEEEDAPETVQDCYDRCLARHPGGGNEFIDCYDKCIEALQLLQP